MFTLILIYCLFLQQSYKKKSFQKVHRLLIVLFLLNALVPANGQIELKFLDSLSNNPIIGATAILSIDSSVYITDQYGAVYINIPNKDKTNFEINIKSIGYDPVSIASSQLIDSKETTFYLIPNAINLTEVLILEDHAKHEHSLASIHLNEKYFSRNNGGTLSNMLSNIPGIQSMEMGPGVGKPVIRGLFGNRIIVNKDYIKQEGQQWGSDHGLEVDPFDAQRVEIVKGPASLQYGSDGLGGVINILPPLLPAEGKIAGEFRSLYKSNNNHKAASLQLGGKKNNYFIQTRLSFQEYDDFTVPSDNFTYNGFNLPLYNGRIKNTAGVEKSFSLMAGYQSEKQVTRFSYSLYDLQSGIFSGAVGIPRSYILTDDGDPSNIDIPFQNVTHQRFTMNHISFIGPNHYSLNIGFQRNYREEHSRPESHSQFDIPTNETKAIGLNLNTLSYETHYELKHRKDGRSVFGSNGQYQQNTRSGFEFLLPDFTLWRLGIYYFTEQKISNDWTISGGGRYDLGQNTNQSFYLDRRDRQGNIFAITEVLSSEKLFHNWSASLGGYYQDDNGKVIRLNIGKTYRIPYPNETSSNGVHHGNFRHEIGTADLTSEQGYQLDASFEYKSKGITFSFSSFLNYFDQYIYLRPTAFFSSLPEAGLLFEYTQHDALYTGFEAEISYDFRESWVLRQGIEYIHSYNINTGLALPFTPPNSILTELSKTVNFKTTTLEGTMVHRFVFENGISRIDRFEQVTPSYHLLDLLIQIKSEKWLKGLAFQLQVSNIFNTQYFNHLSRYRLLNLPEQGRNFIFNLKIPINSFGKSRS